MDPLKKAAQIPVMILLVIFIMVFSFLGYRNEINTQNIALNTAKLSVIVHNQCLQDQELTKGVNGVYETLIAAVIITKSIPEAEKKDRILKYKREMTKSPICR